MVIQEEAPQDFSEILDNMFEIIIFAVIILAFVLFYSASGNGMAVGLGLFAVLGVLGLIGTLTGAF